LAIFSIGFRSGAQTVSRHSFFVVRAPDEQLQQNSSQRNTIRSKPVVRVAAFLRRGFADENAAGLPMRL
jgi:hypothetical protein